MTQTTLPVSERIRRARRIGATFGRIYLGIKSNQAVARYLRPQDMSERWERFHRESAESIYEAAVELRGLILKGCQFLGSRADVLPPAYVDVLSRLQDRVPPKPFHIVKETVEGELGCPLDEVFSEFSERPVAAASLAQVHRAVLHTGERVAVKVQYPEIAALVRSDLGNLRVLFRAVGFIERDFDLMPLVDELATYVPLELDFEHEARSAERVAAYFSERDDVVVPKIYWEHTSRRVLVMEYIDGIKISDTDALQAAGIDSTALMQTVIEAYCEQILVRGFFHADPHAGNLLVRPGEDGAPPQLVFIDFGLSKDLPSGFRQSVVNFALAMLQGQPEAMGRALVDLGFETRDGGEEALHEIATVVLDVASRMRKQAFVDPDIARSAGNELPRLVRENPIVRMPSHVVLLGRVIGLLSGLGRTLDARVDMVRAILPFALGTAGSPPDDDSPSPPPPPPAVA